ncbi:MAG: hypothetical protein FJX74_21100, partial [Armatimonadetes bacterium]|nr:hypothetical protein [Armatimonadota bacterium]
MTHSRRCFLGKGSSVTATALLLLAGAQAWPEVQVIESPALRLSLDLAGGESSVEVKATGVRWPLGASVAEVTFV